MKLTTILVLKIRLEILYFEHLIWMGCNINKIIFGLKGKLENKAINAIKYMF